MSQKYEEYESLCDVISCELRNMLIRNDVMVVVYGLDYI